MRGGFARARHAGVQTRPSRASSAPARQAGTARPVRGCCTSGPSASFQARSARERNAGVKRPVACDLRDALLGSRAEHREPQPAVGGEGLLRARSSRRRLGRCPRADRPRRRWRRSARAHLPLPRVAAQAPSRRWRSRCGPTRRHPPGPRRSAASAASSSSAPGALPGSAFTTIGSPRNGASRGHGCELLRELAEGKMQRATLDETEGGRVPEGGRTAVAERHLVALGRREQLAEPRPDLADKILDRSLPVRGAHDRRAVGDQSGKRLKPHLRRPTAKAPVGGFQLAWDYKLGAALSDSVASSGHPRGMSVEEGCPGARRRMPRRSPVVNST